MTRATYYYWLEQARNYLALHAQGLALYASCDPNYYLKRARTVLHALRNLRLQGVVA